MINDANLSAMIEEAIANIEYPKQPTGLYRPISYTLESGGKRIRPLLLLAACQAVGGKAEDAINQAVGLEMFHNFTLIHDDVMDRSSKRRGRPTVYHRWGDVQAILSGDTLLTMATQYMAQGCPADKLDRVLALFNRTAIEVYEGQQYDMANETRDRVTIANYLTTIRLKTAVLLGCACALGAIMGNGSDADVEALYQYGINIGLAFQLRDDWLDVYSTTKELGKPIGSDIVNRKKTWLYITAFNEATEKMQLITAKQTASRNALVSKVRRVYDSLDLSNRCDAEIERYYNLAIAEIKKANISEESRQWYAALAAKLSRRTK